jgi:hypothetical protein
MSWFAQVLHMLRKELLHARWAVLVWVTLVALGVAHAYGFGGTSDFFGSLMFLTVLFGMGLVAFVVQADSAVQRDAFWPSRPLSPSAVLASKALFAALMLGVGFAGQLVGLAAFDGSVARYAGGAVDGLGLFALWLAVALVLAAITRSLPAFVLLFVGLCIGALFVVNMTVLHRISIPPGVRVAILIVAAGGFVSMLVALYARRDVRIARGVGVLVFVTTLVFAMQSATNVQGGPNDAPLEGLMIRVDVTDSTIPGAAGGLPIVIEGSVPDTTMRLALLNAAVAVWTTDGAKFDVPVFPSQGIGRVSVTTIETGSGTVVSSGMPSFGVAITGKPGTVTNLALTPEQASHVATGVKQVSLRGSVLVQRSSFTASMPLEPGASASSNSARFRVAEVTGRVEGPRVVRSSDDAGARAREENSVAIVTTRVRDARVAEADAEVYAGMAGMNHYEVTVVDRAGKPLHSLLRRNQHSANGWIVLPAQNIVTDVSVYVVPSRGALTAPLDSLARAGATLRISEWTKRATFPVSVVGPLH